MNQAPMFEKHPSIGIFASGVGAASSLSTVMDGLSSLVGIMAGLIGAGVAYYSLRIQRKKYLDSLMPAIHPTVEKRVLLVEDDLVTSDCIDRALTSEGFDVTTVTTGAAAIAACNGTYCCVLLDLVLPDIHGIKVLESLRTSNLDVPVVILSGENNVRSAVRALKLGAIDYLPKPVNRESMVSLLNTLYKLGGARNSYTRLKEAILRET